MRSIIPIFSLSKEALLDGVELRGDGIDGVDEDLAGVIAYGLNFNFDLGLKRMRDFVACEFDFFILEQMHADEIANRVIFQIHDNRLRVDHFLVRNDLHLFGSLVVHTHIVVQLTELLTEIFSVRHFACLILSSLF